MEQDLNIYQIRSCESSLLQMVIGTYEPVHFTISINLENKSIT